MRGGGKGGWGWIVVEVEGTWLGEELRGRLQKRQTCPHPESNLTIRCNKSHNSQVDKIQADLKEHTHCSRYMRETQQLA